MENNNPLIHALPLSSQRVTVDAAAAAHLAANTALLVIDVQKRYAHREKRDLEAEYIAEKVKEFRAAGVQIYAIHMTQHGDLGADDVSKIDFHRFAPEAGDVLLPKTSPSAFRHTNLDGLLKSSGKTNLLACGFMRAACVMETLTDAAKIGGYKLTLLDDMTDQIDDEPDDHLRKNGVDIVPSAKLLGSLRKPKT